MRSWSFAMFTTFMLLFSTTNWFQEQSEFEEMDIKEMNKYLSKFYVSIRKIIMVLTTRKQDQCLFWMPIFFSHAAGNIINILFF